MDELRARLQAFKTTLIKGFEHQCNLFDAHIQTELEPVIARAIQAGALEAENAKLRGTLERAAQRKTTTRDKTLVRISSSNASTGSDGGPEHRAQQGALNDVDSLQLSPQIQRMLEDKDAEIARLNKAHLKLQTKARSLRDSLATEHARFREYRTSRRSSMGSATKVKSSKVDGNGVTDRDNSQVSHSGQGLSKSSSGPSQSTRTDHNHGRTLPEESTPNPERPASAPPDVKLQQPSRVPSTSSVRVSGQSSSDTTDSIPSAEPHHIDNAVNVSNPTLDSPLIVSERSLRKRRRRSDSPNTSNARVKLEIADDQPLGTMGIKLEMDNTSEELVAPLHSPVPHSSMDLDDVNEPLTAAPVGSIQTLPTGNRFHSEREVSPSEDLEKNGISVQAPRQCRTEKLNPGTSAARVRSGLQRVLAPKTPNPRLPSPLKNKFQGLKPRPRDRRSAAAIDTITEDGDNYDSGTAKDSASRSKRLGTLLWGSKEVSNDSSIPAGQLNPIAKVVVPTAVSLSPKKAPATKNAQDVGAQNSAAKRDKDSLDLDRLGKSDVPRSRRGTALQQSATKPRTSKNPQTPRLRETHKARLTPSDFVVNPLRNGGLDFAYSDVVRRQAERACLPNCTKTDCCGDRFSEFVRMSNYKPAPRASLANQFAGIFRSEDDQLIMDYLNCTQERLDYMSSAEKKDVLRSATSWEFGQRLGRHRNAHQRAASPPGLWRTEMPSTQELEADKREAAELSKKTMEERHLEALKPNGRWKFRDEAGC